MARRPRPRKRCKRSRARRLVIKTKLQENPNNSKDRSDSVLEMEEESSESIFNKLLEDQSFRDPNPKTYGRQVESNDKNMETSDSDDDLQDLIIEKSKENDHQEILVGRRIVNIEHIFNEMKILANHSKECTTGCFKLVKETKNGLFTRLMFHCDNCNKNRSITSEPLSQQNELNDALVWGAVSIGIGFSQAEELLGVMDVPIMGPKKFRKHELRVGKVWEDILMEKMTEHAAEEKRIALEKGHLLNGKPYITVIGDGGWGKRSYGHGLNSASGVGVVIGAETKKILFLGVRNKFCYVCSKAKTAKTDAPNHICYKNYCGPSTGMESSVIVEAFKRSEQDHGLIYRYYIGDGDSSVFARIQEGCSYGRFVCKVECANHMTRALSDNLHKLATNTKYPLQSRRLLLGVPEGKTITRLERLVKGVRTAIKQAGFPKSSTGVELLRKDLKNAPNHVFGDHNFCRSTYCQEKTDATTTSNVLPSLDPVFASEIHKLVDRLVRKANSLVFNATTNCAERYMGLVSKFAGGKRTHLAAKGSYQRRCYAAGLSHSKGPSWHLSPWKSFQNRSPGKVLKKTLRSRERVRAKRALKYSEEKPRKRSKTSAGYDKEYGPLATEPDIEESELSRKMQEVLNDLKEEAEKRLEVERNTVGQHDNPLWVEKRLNRLTASNFGQVVKRLDHTPCHNLVKTVLFPKEINSEEIIFGRIHEKTALQQYEMATGNKVDECGLFISSEYPFLGASPDGLVGEEGSVEVKCLPSVDEELKDAVKNKKSLCLEEGPEKCLRLKKTHNYFYQIQGQLNISKREWCDLIVFTRKEELYVERIHVNIKFWEEVMVPKLTRFYSECVLPEIANSRIIRHLKVRDPEYILRARDKREKAKKTGPN